MLSGWDGLTALHLAAGGGHSNILLVLHDGGGTDHVKDPPKRHMRYTPLYLASKVGHIDVKQVLLSKDLKVEVNVKRMFDDTFPFGL